MFARGLVGFMAEHGISGTSDTIVDDVLDPTNIDIAHAVQGKKGERMCVCSYKKVVISCHAHYMCYGICMLDVFSMDYANYV